MDVGGSEVPLLLVQWLMQEPEAEVDRLKISGEDALFTYKTVGTPMAGWLSAKPTSDLIEQECDGEYLQ